jgi:hypothetical protein
MKFGPLMLIEWTDAASLIGSWHTYDEVREELTPKRVRSVGWLVREDAASIVLVASISDTDQLSGDVVIPKGTIVRRRKLNGWKI